ADDEVRLAAEQGWYNLVYDFAYSRPEIQTTGKKVLGHPDYQESKQSVWVGVKAFVSDHGGEPLQRWAAGQWQERLDQGFSTNPEAGKQRSGAIKEQLLEIGK
ncbi:MAG: hypothetical protein ABH867_01915, partial [Patescibacteria group bacterium]